MNADAGSTKADLSSRKMASSFAWSSLENAGAQLAQVVVFFIAARILAPEDVGHASLALIITQAFQSIVCASINGYVVSVDDKRDASAATAAHHLAVAIGLAQFVLILLGSGIYVALGGALVIGGLYAVAGCTNIIVSLGIAHQAWLTRSLLMRSLAIRTLTSVIVAGCCGIAMALLRFSAYAIVLQTLIQATISTALLWVFSPWRPGKTSTREDYRQFFSFTRHMFATGTLNFVASNADMAIVGMFLGARAAGIYAVARRALFAFNGLITTGLSQVSLSIFSRLNQTGTQVLEDRFINIIYLTSMLTVPFFFSVVGLSRPFVELLFGAKWIEAAPIMAILMPAGALQSLGIFNQSFVVSRGRPDLQTRLAFTYVVITIPLLVVTAQFSTIAVAIGYTVRNYLTYPMSMALVTGQSNVTKRQYLAAIAPAFACGAIVCATTKLVGTAVGSTPIVQLVVAGGAAVLAWFASLAVLSPKMFAQITQLVLRRSAAR